MSTDTIRVGRRGSVVIPAPLRRRFGLEEGSYLTVEASAEGLVLRPAMVLPLEQYAPERQAEFLLSNATDLQDYERARQDVARLGIDPDSIPHHRPDGS